MTQTRPGANAQASHNIITLGALALTEDFPELPAQRIVQAIARADDELRTGYAILHLDLHPPQFATEVLGLARQELERATDRLDRTGQAIGIH